MIAGWSVFRLTDKSLLNRSLFFSDGIYSLLGLLILNCFWVKNFTDMMWFGYDRIFAEGPPIWLENFSEFLLLRLRPI